MTLFIVSLAFSFKGRLHHRYNTGVLSCCCCCFSLSHVRLFVTPWTVASQAPLFTDFSRPEYWSGFSSVQSNSHIRLFTTPWTAPRQAPCPWSTPRIYSNSCSLTQDAIQCTISSSVFPFSSHLHSFPALRFFQWVSYSHQVAKVLSFSFSISPSNEYSALISFRMNWLDLLAAQGTL